MQEIPEFYGENRKANEHLWLPSIPLNHFKMIEYIQNKSKFTGKQRTMPQLE